MPVRSFVAVEIQDKQVLSKIREIQYILSSIGADVKLVEPENIHLTMKFLGDISEVKLEKIKAIISDLSFEPFIMTLSNVGVFPNMNRPRTIWAGINSGVESLAKIHKIIESRLNELGFQRDNRSFNPHITLGRVRGVRNRDLLVNAFLDVADTSFGEVNVNAVFLKKSVLTNRGPIYSNLAVSVIG